MSCLDRVTLQEYLDHEMNKKEALRVHAHLRECEVCVNLFEELKSDRDQAMEFLSQEVKNKDSIAIPDPAFNMRKDKGLYQRMWTSKLLKAAAGIALVLGIFLIYQYRAVPGSPDLGEAELLYLELIGNADPNTAWHNGQTLIVLTNEKGEIIHSISNTD